ncbi:hypothetical protein BTVI_27483 [Pitangus sulphuratus]|nr:hypothetical protein BTVI_27483 [Pitangus sulphuratus]
MEAQLEVLEKLESLAFEPGTAGTAPGGERPESAESTESAESAESAEEAPARPEGGGEAQAPPPPAAGAPCSPPPAQLSAPAAAEPLSDSDSDSDADSDSSSATSSSVSSLPSDEDDNSDEKNDRSYCIKTKDELPIEELPPVEDLSIILPDNIELKLFGTVSSIIEQLVIIESLRGLPPVNEESIIFKEDRQPAGKIFEIFGPVLHPFYVLRFNSSEHIKEKGINVQDSMYFAPAVEDFTQYIFTEKLKTYCLGTNVFDPGMQRQKDLKTLFVLVIDNVQSRCQLKIPVNPYLPGISLWPMFQQLLTPMNYYSSRPTIQMFFCSFGLMHYPILGHAVHPDS